MADNENNQGENLDANLGEGNLPQDQNNLRRRIPNNNNLNQPDGVMNQSFVNEKEVTKLYKWSIIVLLISLIISVAVMSYFIYQAHKLTLDLQECNSDTKLVKHREIKAEKSLCEKQLEKWEKMFQNERNYSKEAVNKIITDSESCFETKLDLDECSLNLLYAFVGLAITWWMITCYILVKCCCWFCFHRNRSQEMYLVAHGPAYGHHQPIYDRH